MTGFRTIGPKGVESEEIKPKKLSENRLKSLFPQLTPGQRSELRKASKKYKFKEVQGINEKARVEGILEGIGSAYFKERGYTTLKVFEKYKNVIEAAVLHLKNRSDSVFLGTTAKDEELTMTALGSDAFNQTSTQRIYTAEMGQNNIIPKSSGFYTPKSRKESIFIVGFATTTDVRAIEDIQISLQDGYEARQPFNFQKVKYGDTYILEFPIWVRDGVGMDINASFSKKCSTDLYPIGCRIARASEVSSIM